MFVVRDLINYLTMKENFYIRNNQERVLEAFTEAQNGS